MMHETSFPNDTFLAKWLAGELSAEEWDTWKDQVGEAELNRIITTMEQWEVPATRSKAEAWNQLQATLREGEKPASGGILRSFPAFRWVAVAAAVILLGAMGYLLRDTQISYTTGIGEKLTVVLPDQSEVVLNAGSQLSYDEDDWQERRLVVLDGEAYFRVEEGQRFTVHTDQGEVTVLGTRFNVQDRPEKWEVRCFSGKVEVSPATGDRTLVLNAGQSVRLGTGARIQSESFTPEEQDLWVNDFVRFEGVPLGEVVAELERQYQISIDWPAELDPQETYTGGFPHGDLQTALEMVFGPSNYLPKLEGGQRVTLSPR